jgi:mono/diheme cytochrome c family protein
MRVLACLMLVAALVAGCGGGHKSEPASSLTEGARVFASSCTGCHTLTAGSGPAPAGGPLAGYRMTNAQIESFVRQMPVRRRLSDREVRAVAAFVAHAQRAEAKK